MANPEAYKINTVDGIPVLTLLVESLNARNGHWIKEEVQYFIKETHPKGVFLNLNNVTKVGHIGLGTLIALNNQIRNLQPHAFVCLRPEVKEIIHASNLEKVFQIWTPDQACLICQQQQCQHKPELQKRFGEFLARDYKIDESKIPHLGEHADHTEPTPTVTRPPQALDLDDEAPASSRGLNRLGLALVAVVFLLMVAGGTWLAAMKYANTGHTRFTPLNTEIIISDYDMNSDGQLTPADLPMMDETQRTNLTFSTYCTQLKLTCKQAN